MPAYIYIVKDPHSLEVVYVGQTIDLKKRVSAHLSGSGNSPIGKYMKFLKTNGWAPIFELHKKCYAKTRHTHEIKAMVYFDKQGCFLLNSHSHGCDTANKNLNRIITIKRETSLTELKSA